MIKITMEKFLVKSWERELEIQAKQPDVFKSLGSPYYVAIHEAAHAVVAHGLGHKVIRLVLWPKAKRNTLGYCTIQYKCRRRKTNRMNGFDPIERCVVAIAGHTAEVLWCGAHRDDFDMGDFGYMEKLGTSPAGIHLLRKFVTPMLRKNKATIMRVARALEKYDANKVMSRAAFLRAYRG